MQADFQVESRSYDQTIRGSWQGYRLDADLRLGDERDTSDNDDYTRLWLPSGTPMHWSTGTRPLRYDCVQFFWPQRWYTLSAFYKDRSLLRIYASVIQPAMMELHRLRYVDLDLSCAIEPDFSYEVLTQVEFEELARTFHYSEDTRVSALVALQTLTNSIQLGGMGLFGLIPYSLKEDPLRLAPCSKK